MSREAKTHEFGGAWTEQKLAILGHYLSRYTTALAKTPSPERPFKLLYVDAFAGTGSRSPTARARNVTNATSPLFDSEATEFLAGSARIALATTPPFSELTFIDKDPGHCEQLRKLASDETRPVSVLQGDANTLVRQICSKTDWRSRRAVMFLDPYGSQVEWATLEAIASTRAVDLWILFPVGIVVNRLLARSGQISSGWRRRLDLVFGTPEWADRLYKTRVEESLFGPSNVIEKADILSIGRLFVDRLGSIFPGVSQRPRVLYNSRRSPLYLLCFAAANEKGSTVALRIANHLLAMGEQ